MTYDQLVLQVQDLEKAVAQMGEKDKGFAASLCQQFYKKGLSPKQAEWVGKLLDRVNAPAPQTHSVSVGSLTGIVDLLKLASEHLKYPKIIVRANDQDFRLSVAGSNSKMPGSVNVCSTVGGFGQREWYGRVTQDGEFHPCQKYSAATQTAVAEALKALALDPAKAAADYGHLTGVCCFCGKGLTDERSTSVGYGPICAGHYGLPWGDSSDDDIRDDV